MLRSAALPVLAVLALSVPGAFGCAALAGVDFDAARLQQQDVGDASLPDGFIASIPPAPDAAVRPEAGSTCGPDEKVCNGACVKTSDPLFGCGGAACEPCSLPNATSARCDAAGACVVDSCAPQHADCNAKASDGCEADLTSPSTCGACTVACGASAPLCTPSGCATGCPDGTVRCGSTCIDTNTTPGHCGSCDKSCPDVTNGSPACAGGTCSITCNAGYADCDGNPVNGCEALQTFYKDSDGDGVGGATTKKACSAPAGYVGVGGDCEDGNKDVHPGQQSYFGTPYTSSAGPSSFDYDCNGAADEDPSAVKLTGCDASCNLVGYVANGASYCGSTTYYQCATYASNCPASCYTNPVPECGLVCQPVCGAYAATAPSPFRCR